MERAECVCVGVGGGGDERGMMDRRSENILPEASLS